MPLFKLLFHLRGYPVRADGRRVALDIVNAFSHPDPDLSQPLQHLLVVHHRPQRFHPAALGDHLLQHVNSPLHPEAEAYFPGLFNLHRFFPA